MARLPPWLGAWRRSAASSAAAARSRSRASALIERGLRNTLAHFGILAPPTDRGPAPPIRLIQVPGRDYFVYAPEPGLFEPLVKLSDWVEAGQVAGQVHFVDNPRARPCRAASRPPAW
jgi:uncharacterized protein